jgi:hypothetical protein
MSAKLEDAMSELPRTGASKAVASLRALVVHGVVLGACAGVLCCSPSHEEEAGPAAPEAAGALSHADAAVKYWMAEWGKQPHEEPMYLRLPVGVDTRGWGLMHEGFTDYLSGQQNGNRPTKEHYEKDYEFTWDVFTWNIPLWRPVLEPFAGRSDVHYLEIGISEGRATLWMLENILTDPTSRATGIDPFLVEGHEERLRENLRKFASPEKVQVIKGFSQDVLPELEPDSYDIIYIDGSHLAGDVLFDAVYTWRLLRDEGLVIHDDYMWQYKHRQPPDMHPLVAIDAFITGKRNTAQVLHRGRQLILRKLPLELPGFCWNRDPCLRIGNYLYAWNSHRLLEVSTEKAIPLTKRERAVLRKILRSRRIGAEAELVLEEDIAALRSRFPKEFERLETLLDLKSSSPPAPGTPAKPGS